MLLRRRLSMLLSETYEFVDPERTFALETSSTILDSDRPADYVDWVNTAKPASATVVTLSPTTSSGNGDQPAVGLRGLTMGDPGAPCLFIQGGIHGSEMTAPLAVMEFLNRVAAPAGANSAMWQELQDTLRFAVIPAVNPAGYQISPTYSYGARKAPNFAGPPYTPHLGTDPNRNYPWRWNEDTGTTPSSDSYKGPSVMVLPEIQAATNFFSTNQPFAALDIHMRGNSGTDNAGIDNNNTAYARHYAAWARRRKAELETICSGIVPVVEWNVTASPTATGWFSQQLAVDNLPCYGQIMEIGCTSPAFAEPRTTEMQLFMTAMLMMAIRWKEVAVSRDLI